MDPVAAAMLKRHDAVAAVNRLMTMGLAGREARLLVREVLARGLNRGGAP